MKVPNDRTPPPVLGVVASHLIFWIIMKHGLDMHELQDAFQAGWDANPLTEMISMYAANYEDRMMKEGYDYPAAHVLWKYYVKGALARLEK